MNLYLQAYEESNLKVYAGAKYDNFLLLKHPQKNEAKESLENLPKEMLNPFRIMKLWLRWESLDIVALLEAIEVKIGYEAKKQRRISKKESDR